MLEEWTKSMRKGLQWKLVAPFLVFASAGLVHASTMCVDGNTLAQYVSAGSCQYGSLLFTFYAGPVGTYTLTGGDHSVTSNQVIVNLYNTVNPDGTGDYGLQFTPTGASGGWVTTAAMSGLVNVNITYEVSVCANPNCTTPLGPQQFYAIAGGEQIVPFGYTSDANGLDIISSSESYTVLSGAGGASLAGGTVIPGDGLTTQRGTFVACESTANPGPCGPVLPQFLFAEDLQVAKSNGAATIFGADAVTIQTIKESYDVALVNAPEPGMLLLTMCGLGLLLIAKRKRVLGTMGAVALAAAVSGTAQASPIACTSLTGETLYQVATQLNLNGGCVLNGLLFNGLSYSTVGNTTPGSAGETSNFATTGGLAAISDQGPKSITVNFNFAGSMATIDLVPVIIFGSTSSFPSQSEFLNISFSVATTPGTTVNSVIGSISASGTGSTSSITGCLQATSGVPGTATVSAPCPTTSGGDTATLNIDKTASSTNFNSGYTVGGQTNLTPGSIPQSTVFQLSEDVYLKTSNFRSPSGTNTDDSVHLSDLKVTFNETVAPEPVATILVGCSLVFFGICGRRRVRKS